MPLSAEGVSLFPYISESSNPLRIFPLPQSIQTINNKSEDKKTHLTPRFSSSSESERLLSPAPADASGLATALEVAEPPLEAGWLGWVGRTGKLVSFTLT
ncbi:hypothetical protein E2C01_076842 [Portunus trituberculatus]|uniref:Uncharacterized protein n=1 Tax=Portunus trituberculatus TaxID=210409 RepID=A0A5B7IIQ5_PORTR|nr:hypothetical protein [Portunus trituberculatus]